MSDPQEELRSQDSGKSSRGPGRQGTGLGRPPRVAPGQGLLAHHWALRCPVSSVFLSLGERRQGTGCPGGRALPGRKAPPGVLEGTGDHGVLGAMPTRRLLPGRRGGGRRSSIWSTSLFRTALQSAIPASSLLPGVHSGDGDWGLCLRGLQRRAPGLQQPVPLRESQCVGRDTGRGGDWRMWRGEGTESTWADQGGLPGGSDS